MGGATDFIQTEINQLTSSRAGNQLLATKAIVLHCSNDKTDFGGQDEQSNSYNMDGDSSIELIIMLMCGILQVQ